MNCCEYDKGAGKQARTHNVSRVAQPAAMHPAFYVSLTAVLKVVSTVTFVVSNSREVPALFGEHFDGLMLPEYIW